MEEFNNQAYAQTKFCSSCGKTVDINANICPFCGAQLAVNPQPQTQPNYQQPPVQGYATYQTVTPQQAYKKITDYEKTSGIVWIVVGALQCISLVGIICGVWNIIVGIQRLNYSKELERMPAGIYSVYDERQTGIIVMLVANVLIGGLIGVAGAVLDLVARSYVMDHPEIFGGPARPTVPVGNPYVAQAPVQQNVYTVPAQPPVYNAPAQGYAQSQQPVQPNPNNYPYN